MFLTKLNLLNFRNLKRKEIIFDKAITILTGPNTVGKTSILEAIFYLATGRSFRAEKDIEVIEWGESVARIRSKIKNQKSKMDDEGETLEIVFTDKKRFLVNGVGKRMVDFVGHLKVVLFWPEDLNLVTDSPSLRRRYLDFVLMQVDREYRRSLISYERGLRQRNRLLERIRSEGVSRSQLLFWDQLLIKNGNYITSKREEYISFMNKQKSNLGDFESFYDLSRISPARLAEYAEEEVLAGVTLVGPHRDDFVIKIKNQKPKIKNNKENIIDGDLSVYGSRGEQRLAVLWLKMCELEFIESKSGDRPILLLDDIFSELDQERRKLVFDIVDRQQTIITTVDWLYIGEDKKERGEIIEI